MDNNSFKNTAGMVVTFGRLFRKHLRNFPDEDRLKIMKFAKHVEQFGLADLEGRNKSSDGFLMMIQTF